jgi:hypothetical protein
MIMQRAARLTAVAAWVVAAACGGDPAGPAPAVPKDPAKAPKVSVDRFSAAAGHLQVRTATNGLPAANAPVDFDTGPFITRGLTPAGQPVTYYNFDVQPEAPAPIFVLMREGETTPVAGQLNIIDVIPGDPGYSDFWQVVEVRVPKSYVANTVTSVQEIIAAGYRRTMTNVIVNCPVVPEGSVARRRLNGESAAITRGWYKGMTVPYFTFGEKSLVTTTKGLVPTSGIFVTFNINPTQPNGGPASGFRTETGTEQTHNVLATVPTDAGYSPLWVVNVYDNAAFNSVRNITSAAAAPLLASAVALVNCPVVSFP